LKKKPAWGPKSYSITQLHNRDDQEEEEEDNEREEIEKPAEPEETEYSRSESDHDDVSSQDFDDDSVGIKPKASEYIPCPEDDEFAKQYEQMMNEDREQRKADAVNRTALLNMSIPMNLLRRPTSAVQPQPPPPPAPVSAPTPLADSVAFKVLIKGKGNRQKAVDLSIPQDSKLASQHLKIKSRQAQQQEEMKRLVLQYDERDRKLDEENKKKKNSPS